MISLNRPPTVPLAPTRGEVTLAAESLSVRRGSREVVRQVDLEVRAGQFVALVGPNGAGKSSLLAALAGDLAPVAGSVELNGRGVRDVAPSELALSRAVLTQSVEVSFPFTVSEVVAMGRAPWSRIDDREDDAHVIERSLAQVEVGHLANRRFPTLSGGERARVALARVLAQRTPLLMLDEPTAALDIGHQEQVFAALRAEVDAGSTVVVVVHDLALASRWTDSMALLDEGRLVAHGPPSEVLTPALLSAVYRHEVQVAAHPVDGSLLIAPLAPTHAPRHSGGTP